MTSPPTLDSLRAVIVRVFPDLAGATFTLLNAGWDSLGVDVDDRLIFRFPRHAAAEAALGREAHLLAVIRGAVTMTVPDLMLHPGPPLFSRHRKIAGEHLVTAQYKRLPDHARQRLAADMALFYAELHKIDGRVLAQAGAPSIKPWLRPDDIVRRAIPALPPAIRPRAAQTIAAWQALPPDPYGTTYGFFDGHGWNMAFDQARGRLNGLYDFGDSGFGALHQEFIYSNLIAPDLTARIIDAYEGLTGRTLDRRRIDMLSGVWRLSELAEYADDATHAPTMIKGVVDWAEGWRLEVHD